MAKNNENAPKAKHLLKKIIVVSLLGRQRISKIDIKKLVLPNSKDRPTLTINNIIQHITVSRKNLIDNFILFFPFLPRVTYFLIWHSLFPL
jgi:hypothetical protein